MAVLRHAAITHTPFMPSPTTPSADLPRPAASTGHPAPASGVGRRVARWLLVALGVVATLLVLLGALLAVIDWNRAKPWVNEKVSEATGRHFAIEGELSAAWHWPQPLEEGWRRWIPGVTVQAERLVMDQPAGFIPPFQRADGKTPHKDNADLPEAPAMARIGSATATGRLLPLLGRHLSNDTVALPSPQVALARAASGTAPTAAIAAPGTSSQGAMPYGLRFELKGRYAKAQIKGQGRAGQVISLRNKVVNYPLQIDASAGSVALSAEGVLANPGALSGLDFQVFLQGGSMADLYDLTGLVLPNTPAFETRGRLTGSLEPERAVWEYNDFRGKAGQSDLQGSLKYASGKPRPRLTGTMTSNQLRLADLGPTLGTRVSGNTQRTRSQGGKVLPDSQFAAERWNAMDMDIVFKGRHIIRPESLPLQDLSTRAVMENAQLRLAPLTFGVAEGKIESQVTIDGRSAPLKAQIRGTVQGRQLWALFPKVQLMKKSFGRMDGAIALESTGNSMAVLLGHGTGEMRLYVREGTLSKQMLDLAALNVGSIIVGKLFGENKEVHLRCAVADFMVVDGLATARVVKMSTDDAVVEATGTIDLGTEALDLRIKPESLQWKFFSLRSPLYVRGTFGNPDVGVEAGPLLLRAGAAVVAVVVAGLLLPERIQIPVAGASAKDWNSKSFWFEPWGSSGVHKGIDIFGKTGTPVLSTTDGVVLFTGEIAKGGKVVLVLGPRWRLHYFAHLDSIRTGAFSFVASGDAID